MGFGSRQVRGGKGPGNPHGEEGELLYYIDRTIVEGEYRVVMNNSNDNTIQKFVGTNQSCGWISTCVPIC